jgi:hypothetical protein
VKRNIGANKLLPMPDLLDGVGELARCRHLVRERLARVSPNSGW